MNLRSRLRAMVCAPCIALTLVTLSSQFTLADAQTTVAADRFVDSVGVNVHLHYDNTIYRNNFDLIKSRLIELRVRHVRDGLVDTAWQDFYARHNALGQAGIRGTFITMPNQPNWLLQAYPSRLPASFEAYEAPNEFNYSGGSTWDSVMRTTLTQLYALKSIPALSSYTIVGPSLTDEAAYTKIGDISWTIDAG